MPPEGWLEAPENAVVGHDLVAGEVLPPVITVEDLRVLRNAALAESDWRDLPSYAGTDQAEWRTYRQALRDITEGYTESRINPLPGVPGYSVPAGFGTPGFTV